MEGGGNWEEGGGWREEGGIAGGQGVGLGWGWGEGEADGKGEREGLGLTAHGGLAHQVEVRGLGEDGRRDGDRAGGGGSL